MNEFRVCPVCNYGLGFHTSYKKDGDQFKVIFICPNCKNAFDLGIKETTMKELNPIHMGKIE